MDKRLTWITKYNEENNNEYKNFIFSGEYLAVYKPSHPKSRKDGYVYIHQLQAEKKLGRHLKDNECVHHIDEDKFNNDVDNLMIFKTVADHTAFHKGNKIFKKNDVWVATIVGKFNTCPLCGKLKYSVANMCEECYAKERAKNIPSKQDLEKLIYTTSFVALGKLYGVTDNAVRKWCKKYGLPYKRKDILNYYKEYTLPFRREICTKGMNYY